MSSAYFLIYTISHGRLFVMAGNKQAGMPNNGGQLTFPGGRINHKEQAKRAATRELLEETGLNYNLTMHRFLIPGKGNIQAMNEQTIDLSAEHSVVFVELGGDDFSTVCREARGRVAMAARGHAGYVQDAEYSDMGPVTARQAFATMCEQGRNTDPTRQTDWFKSAVTRLRAITGAV
jgi:ADP-ribose pyrophosphatase YjhB (NUDIX family)